jgi:hypothetical protein
MPKDWTGRYVGVDQSQDFINIAGMIYQEKEF